MVVDLAGHGQPWRQTSWCNTRRQVEIVEARIATLQDKVDKMTPLLPHTPPSPTVTRALGYPEVWGDRTTWREGAWPEQVPDPDPNPDPNPETVMTCCTCTSRPVHKQPASVQVRVQSPAQDIEDIEDLFQGEVGYEVQTCAEILLSLQANTPPALPVQRATSTGSMATHPPTSPSRMVAAVDIDWPGHEGPTHTLPSSDVWSRGLQESDLIDYNFQTQDNVGRCSTIAKMGVLGGMGPAEDRSNAVLAEAYAEGTSPFPLCNCTDAQLSNRAEIDWLCAARDAAAEELQWQQLLQERARQQVAQVLDPNDLLPGGSDVLSPSSNVMLDEIFGDMELADLLRNFNFGDEDTSPVGQPAPPEMPPPEATQPTFPPPEWGQPLAYHHAWGQPSMQRGTPNPMAGETIPTCPVSQQNDWLQGSAQVGMVQVTGAHKDPLAGSADCPIVIDDDTSPTMPGLELEDWSSDFLRVSSPRTVTALGEGSHADTVCREMGLGPEFMGELEGLRCKEMPYPPSPQDPQNLVRVETDLAEFITSNASHTPTHSPPKTPPSDSKKRGRDEAVGK